MQSEQKQVVRRDLSPNMIRIMEMVKDGPDYAKAQLEDMKKKGQI